MPISFVALFEGIELEEAANKVFEFGVSTGALYNSVP
jgi:hypothetical protein